jgi:hypothetical protein
MTKRVKKNRIYASKNTKNGRLTLLLQKRRFRIWGPQKPEPSVRSTDDGHPLQLNSTMHKIRTNNQVPWHALCVHRTVKTEGLLHTPRC